MSMPTGISKSVKGTGYKQFNTPTMGPEQTELFKNLFSGSREGINSGLKNLSGLASGDESQFKAMEAPALRQFGQLKGNIASQFSGVGSGARRSSGFKNTMNSAATDLSERLQQNRISMQQDAIRQLLGIGDSLLGQRTFETNLVPKKQNPAWGILGSLFGGASNIGSNLGTMGLSRQWGLNG